jgi:hypothetical protein
MGTMKPLAFVLFLGLSAAADEVVLRNGSVFSGVVKEDGERVTIQMDYGTMSFKRIDVREIRRSEDPLKDLETKTLKATTAEELYAVAVWARDQKLPGRADELLKKVLSLEPEHEGARRALGYERIEGRWLHGDDLMRAQGYEKHNGRWLTREAMERLKERELEESLELERQKTLRQTAEMNREVELQKIELERERIQMELERARRERFNSPYGWGPYPVCPPVVPAPWPSFTLSPGRQGPPAHPGYGPGRRLPPVPERVYPGGIPSSTPPPTPHPRASKRSGSSDQDK